MRIYNQTKYKNRRQNLRSNLTYPEKLLWNRVRNEQIGYKFRRQHGIGIYIVDFYVAEKRTIIEIDGDSHFNKHSSDYDYRRDCYLKRLSHHILRFNNNQVVNETDEVIDFIVDFLNTISFSSKIG